MGRFALATLLFLHSFGLALAGDGNRLAYLDGDSQYAPSRSFPKLTTPQWVGKKGVEAVIVFAIDDMRGHPKWEAYLRPILERLKKIDGRAPVSIMTCQIDPKEKHLQKWLKEGLSIEAHTFAHPCPILKGGNLATAKATYDKCVDLLAEIPGSRPVAFRTPCCDSLNTPSPRMFAEIFDKKTPKKNYLTIDSSVFNVFTPNNPKLPRNLVLEDGTPRFAKYLPKDRAFGNTIEDYPYPYLIGRKCWEFPCATPSDWQAQHLHKPNNPITVRDWKACLDATVISKGVFCLVFHPHGWIENTQVIEFIDYAVEKYGKRIEFLNFRECEERLNKHLLEGNPVRTDAGDNGVRLLDLNDDGYMDIVVGNTNVRKTRLWNPKTKTWTNGSFPVQLTSHGTGAKVDGGVRFGVVQKTGFASILTNKTGWHFNGTKWNEDTLFDDASGPLGPDPVGTSHFSSARLRDIDGDGRCEWILSTPKSSTVSTWIPNKVWKPLPFALPKGVSFVDEKGRDNGVRLVDVNEDGKLDVLASNEKGYSLHLFESMKKGWTNKILEGKRGTKGEVPMIARRGTNNGAWFHSRSLWVQNEDTAVLKDHVRIMSFQDMLKGTQPGPKSPQASLKCLHPRPGFVAELVASEPLVADPIAFDWGPDGKLWVVEMGDYPLGSDGKGTAGGRIKYLEDTNNDGKYDKATLFLAGIEHPTGILPWKTGVLFTAAPNICYAEDHNGDGKADRVEKLYTGFGRGNQQHRVNTLAIGLDGWIYCANGDSDGSIRSSKTGKVVNIGGRDFRIRPETGDIETTTGRTQFGRSRDDFGNWFGGNNSNPMWHFVLRDNYLRRNKHVAAPFVRTSVVQPPGPAPVFPLSRTLPRFNDFKGINRFTSACSPIVYRDNLFGPEFVGNAFISEPVHNLVHREIIEPHGFTFRGKRAPGEERAEFLASTDNWFRPTMIRTGPDGALWVADMYRHVIEHPQWIPPDWQKRLDLRAGHDKGRIYRIYPMGAKLRSIPKFGTRQFSNTVALLESPNGWVRDSAMQYILWRNSDKLAPSLVKLLQRIPNPLARLHAICTLDGLNMIKTHHLEKALTDPHPGIRRHAVRISEKFLKSGQMGLTLLSRATDADPQVRIQLAYSLGEWDHEQAGIGLGKLAMRDPTDRILVTAVMSSITKKNLSRTLRTVLEAGGHRSVLAELLGLADKFGERDAMRLLLEKIATPKGDDFEAWQYAALAGLLEVATQRGESLQEWATRDKRLAPVVEKLTRLRERAKTTANNAKTNEDVRAAAVTLLGRWPNSVESAYFSDLVVPSLPEPVTSAAIAALARRGEANALFAKWKSITPRLRVRVLAGLMERKSGAQHVLAALERKTILPFEVDAIHRQRLLQTGDAKLRERAKQLLQGGIDSDRKALIARFRPQLGAGNVTEGKKLFEQHCAACHKLGDIGSEVGPDLKSLQDRSTDAMLTAILDPNRAIEAKYIGYLVELSDGRTLTGVLLAETSTSINLVAADGKQHAILRTNIEEMVSTGKSAMPEGFEKSVRPEELGDLIRFVQEATKPK